MKIGNVVLKINGSIRAEVCSVGPKEAEYLLGFNTHNRKISEGTVNKYSDEILRGAWVSSCAGIGFNEDGVLIDGQHRLAAIIKSGCTVQLLIVTGLPKLTQEKVDRHLKRTLYDVFKLSGVCDKKSVIQTATYLARRNNHGWSAVSDEEVKETLLVHWDSLIAVDSETKQSIKKVNSTGVRAAITIAHELHGEKALQFYRAIQSDLHSVADDPAHRFRVSVLNMYNGTGMGGGYQDILYKKTCYAFNAFVNGKRISSVQTADDIVKPEK